MKYKDKKYEAWNGIDTFYIRCGITIDYELYFWHVEYEDELVDDLFLCDHCYHELFPENEKDYK